MGKYTEELENRLYGISPEDENFREELVETAVSFRTFGEALTQFLVERGYTGKREDTAEKVKYIRSVFRKASVDEVPRNLKECFDGQARLAKRKTAYAFCAAFHLSLEESEDFFRRIYLQRGFDCHRMEEAVWYFAVKNGLSWTESEQILSKIPHQDVLGTANGDSACFFTGDIVKRIDTFRNSEELIAFLIQHKEEFSCVHVTACRTIRQLWEKIGAAGGLADREKADYLCNECRGKKRGCAGRGCKKSDCSMHDLYYCGCQGCQCRKCSCRLHTQASRSVWEIYQQIFGYSEGQIEQLSGDGGRKKTPSRSLAPVIKDSALLHVLAQEAFPDRQGLEAILRGERKSDELIRKTLILLLFYQYWTDKALRKRKQVYEAEPGEAEHCISRMNAYLEEAGYFPLYAGNPYDWLFLFASVDDAPLTALREIMRELYLAAEEKADAVKKGETSWIQEVP